MDKKLSCPTHKIDRAGGGSLDKRVSPSVIQHLHEHNEPIKEAQQN